MTLPSCALEKGVSMFCFCCFSKQGYCSFPTDNVTLQIDGVLYLRVMDPYKVQSLPLGHLSPSSAHSLLPKMCAQVGWALWLLPRLQIPRFQQECLAGFLL